jgi:hypothetical protein
MHGRKSAASVAPGDALVPFWAYTLLVYAEAAAMLAVLTWRDEPWARPYVVAAAAVVGAWGAATAVWLALEAASAAAHAADDAALDAAAGAVDAAALEALDQGGGGAGGSPSPGKQARACDACGAAAGVAHVHLDVEAGVKADGAVVVAATAATTTTTTASPLRPLVGRRVAGSDSGASGAGTPVCGARAVSDVGDAGRVGGGGVG